MSDTTTSSTTTNTLVIPDRPSRPGEPIWELLDLFPQQGSFSEADYLQLKTNRLVEYTQGVIELLPMPTYLHQMIAGMLWVMLRQLRIDGSSGRAVQAPFKLKIGPARWREPDVAYLLPSSLDRHRNEWWDWADLVIEIVSEEGGERDYQIKPADYAALGVPEYWIVDPQRGEIRVLTLDADGYRLTQQALRGQIARSAVVPGFEVDVADLFDQAAQ